eukprot:CAMPEP_0168557280 /NCGR_PEP_ID=MMETSP0413-20121227/9341_1 /TAXON_ID=136452 /ORGANISM="Filamoeba nolandi, Strain NC-AS-23-1" /LENGTH=170 /DNA_ID=CAMNT_0008588301 /DNA_START=18 /DNA_END=530 /DNA_ORIENTATION=-
MANKKEQLLNFQQMTQYLDEDDEDLVAEFTMEQFMDQLNKYPKVRDRNYQVPEISENSGKLTTSKANTTSSNSNNNMFSAINAFMSGMNLNQKKPGQSNPTKQITSSAQEEDSPFMAHLRTTLLSHYSQQDVNSIMNEFKTLYSEMVDSLSLDDIERIANGMQQMDTSAT